MLRRAVLPAAAVVVALGVVGIAIGAAATTGAGTGAHPGGGMASHPGGGGMVTLGRPTRPTGTTMRGALPKDAGTSALVHNERVAHFDAAAALGRLRLPAGATRSAREPAGDAGLLKPMNELEGDSAHVVTHEWWTVGGSPRGVIAYVRAHRPTGGTLFVTGSSGNAFTGRSSLLIEYSWPPIAGVLGTRELSITVTQIARGRTGVLVQSQTDWIVPRPAGELVPASAHEVDITSKRPRGRVVLSRSVIAPAKVLALAALIDGLPIVQPVVINCPGIAVNSGHVITLTFRAASGRPALAVAQFTDYPGWDGTSGECNAIDFSIRGRQQTALIGGPIVRELKQILGYSPVGG